MTIEIVVSTPKGVPAGCIDCELRNTGTALVRILRWGTPLDVPFADAFEVMMAGNIHATFNGPRAKRVYDEQGSTVLLKPGCMESVRVDISALYRIPATATYSIRPRTEAVRAIAVHTAERIGAVPAAFKVARVESNCIDVMLQGGMGVERFPRASDASWDELPDETPITDYPHGSAGPICPPSFICFDSLNVGGECFGGDYISYPPTKDISADGARTLRRAYIALFKRIKRLNVQNNALYRRWFGAYDVVRFQHVQKVLRGIVAQQMCKSHMCYTTLGSCTSDVIAWFWRSPMPERLSTMQLCPPFFRLPDQGLDSNVGTIAHELSHGYGDTEDFTYGAANCLALAKKTPAKAVRNADNYQYFIEEYVG